MGYSERELALWISSQCSAGDGRGCAGRGVGRGVGHAVADLLCHPGTIVV